MPNYTLNQAFDELYKRLKNDSFYKKFSKSKCVVERLQLCQESPILRERLASWMSAYTTSKFHKSLQQSVQMRTEGNRNFQTKNYNESLEFYTQSIMYAPFESHSYLELGEDSLAIGYANRSAVFYYLKKYKLCLEDIARAINANYPSNLLYKLYIRKANSLFRLNDMLECNKTAAFALHLLNVDHTIPEERKEHLQNELKELLKSSETTRKSDCKVLLAPEIPKVSFGTHVKLISASSALGVQFNTTQGRHIVVNQTVNAGTTLIVEKPFASILIPDHYNSHCHHCYVPIEAALPCQKCSQVRYCSDSCQRKAFGTYHRVECGHLDLLHDAGLGHLVLRVLLKAGLPYLLENRGTLEQLKEDQSIREGLPEGPFGNNYYSMFSLSTNAAHTTVDDMLAYCICATMLLKLLKGEMKSINVSSGDKLFIGSLLVRHIQQLICNAHAITKLHVEPNVHNPMVESKAQTRIASAIYPVASLVNHSCDPTIMLSFVNDVLVARAIKDMKTGDQVFNCYGPHYCRMPKAQRQQTLLQQYFFICNCQRCQEDNEEDVFKAFKCRLCDGPVYKDSCMDCLEGQNCSELSQELKFSLTLFEHAKDCLESSNLDDAVKTIEECLQCQCCVLYKFHDDLAKSQDLAARCYAMKGYYEKSVIYIRPTLETTEKKYGSKSIELANELQKFTDVLWRTIVEYTVQNKENVATLRAMVEDAAAAVERGIEIYNIHYGKANASTKDMLAKQECLSNILNTIDE